MRIAVERRPAPHEAAFLNLLASSCERLGHGVWRFRQLPSGTELHGDGNVLTWNEADCPGAFETPNLWIRWGCRVPQAAPTLHAELGWLPRWHYQLSHTGINAKHHLAAPALKPLTDKQEREAENHLRECRMGRECPFPYADPRVPAAENVPADGFVLAPLQMPQDTNMENAPEHLRTEQGFIDAVSEMDPPWPIVFKQHCHSGAGYQIDLQPPKDKRREQVEITAFTDAFPRYIDGPSIDRIAPHAEASIHAYLKSPACRAVVTVNSNTAHDALLWDVPVVALGEGFWPAGLFGEDTTAALPSAWKAAAYVHHLTRAQWRLEDAADIGRVARAIERAVG